MPPVQTVEAFSAPGTNTLLSAAYTTTKLSTAIEILPVNIYNSLPMAMAGDHFIVPLFEYVCTSALFLFSDG